MSVISESNALIWGPHIISSVYIAVDFCWRHILNCPNSISKILSGYLERCLSQIPTIVVYFVASLGVMPEI